MHERVRHTERVLVERVPYQVRLEQRAHLGIARTRVVEDQEVDLERCHVNQERKDDQTCNPGSPMPDLVTLGRTEEVSYDVDRCAHEAVTRTTDIFKSPNFSHRSSMVYAPTREVTKRPTHFTLDAIICQDAALLRTGI